MSQSVLAAAKHSPKNPQKPARSVGADRSRSASGRGGQARRRRCRRCGRRARRVAGRRNPRRQCRGVRARRGRRRGLARADRAASRRWCRPTISWPMSHTLAERAVAMARIAPEDKYAGLADPVAAGEGIPGARSARSRCSVGRGAGTPRAGGRSRGPCGEGRHKIRRRFGVRGHRRHGAGDQHRVSAARICARARASR